MEKQTFIQTVGETARKDMEKSGVLASLTIAQAILESGWGISELAQNANALFGIKADSRWSGKAYSKETQECYDGVNYTTVTALFRAYGSWDESIADHSTFLLTGSRYAAVIGEKDYKTACKAIKAAGYATAPDYAEKLISLIESYGLTAYDGDVQKEEPTLKIIESILTKNPCYTGGRKLDAVKGLMLHSVGCPQPSAQVFVKNWNSPSHDSSCVHGFIDGNTGDVYQCLPWGWRGWHGASGPKGSCNNTHIGVEMCEPSTIKYTGGASWVETGDGTNTKATVMRTYKSAVELFAYLCKKFGLNPLGDGVIISHSEGHKRGIASNHGDVEHIWNKFGLTMDQFRRDVKATMDKESGGEKPQQPEDKPAGGSTLYYVQAGAFSKKENAEAHAKTLKAAGFDTMLKTADGLYKVQTGAYSVKANADAQVKALKAAGFDAFVTTNGGSAAPAPSYIEYTVKKGDSLWAIAAKLLGDGRRYTEIKALSGLTSDTIYAGNVLKVPAK